MQIVDKISNMRNFDEFKDSPALMLLQLQHARTQCLSSHTLTKYLTVFTPSPASSAASEGSHFTAGRVIQNRRTCPKPSITDGTNFLNSSLLK